LWNSDNGQFIKVFQGHKSGIYQAAFSPDGSKLITASGDGARLWDINQ
jgi:WD40 repeat protein